MSFLSRWLSPPAPPLSNLWNWITTNARQPHWYLDYQVADTVDGRFDMVALLTSLVMIDLERREMVPQTSILTERFVEDMDGSLREIGIGDMVIGKHMGKVMGALGGRISAYREALAEGAAPNQLADALGRNVFRAAAPEGVTGPMAETVRALFSRIQATPADKLLAGEI